MIARFFRVTESKSKDTTLINGEFRIEDQTKQSKIPQYPNN